MHAITEDCYIGIPLFELKYAVYYAVMGTRILYKVDSKYKFLQGIIEYR